MGLIAVPSAFNVQPQFPAKIARQLQSYSPKIVVQPCSGTNAINGRVSILTSGVSRPANNYSFSGGSGYIDLGSDAYIDTGVYSILVVSRIKSFPVQYAAVAGIKNTVSNNALIIYSTNPAYSDISFGQELTSYQYSLAAFGPVIGTWHSMVYTQTGASTGKLFCNGRVATKGGAAGLAGGTGNTTLGQFSPATAGTYPLDGEIATFILFKGLIPDALAQALSANPWRAFEAPDEEIWINSASFNSYTITPSGGVVFGGTSTITPIRSYPIIPSGGIVFSGTSPLSGTKSYLISPSGGIVFGGTAPIVSSNATTYIITPSGGITFSGTSLFIKSHIQIPIGGIVFSGNAPMSSNTVISTVTTRLPLTGVGS